MTEFEHARHQRRRLLLRLQHRGKALAPPGRLVVGIQIQACGGLGLYPAAAVDRQLAGAALGTTDAPGVVGAGM